MSTRLDNTGEEEWTTEGFSAALSLSIGGALLGSALLLAGIFAQRWCCTQLTIDDIAPAVGILVNFALHFIYLGGFMIDASWTQITLLLVWALYILLTETSRWRQPSGLQQMPRSLTTKDVFEDVSIKTLKSIFVGIGQVILLTYYICGVCYAPAPTFTTRQQLGYYLSGVTISLGYAIGREDLNLKRWVDRSPEAARSPLVWWILAARKGMSCSYNCGAEDHVVDLSGKRYSLLVRYALSVIVNGYGSALLRCFIPLQLANSQSPILFVLDSVAAFFVLELGHQPDREFMFYLFSPQQHLEGQIELPLEPQSVRWKTKWSPSGRDKSMENFRVSEEESLHLVIDVDRSEESDVIQFKSIRIVNPNKRSRDREEDTTIKALL